MSMSQNLMFVEGTRTLFCTLGSHGSGICFSEFFGTVYGVNKIKSSQSSKKLLNLLFKLPISSCMFCVFSPCLWFLWFIKAKIKFAFFKKLVSKCPKMPLIQPIMRIPRIWNDLEECSHSWVIFFFCSKHHVFQVQIEMVSELQNLLISTLTLVKFQFSQSVVNLLLQFVSSPLRFVS